MRAQPSSAAAAVALVLALVLALATLGPRPAVAQNPTPPVLPSEYYADVTVVLSAPREVQLTAIQYYSYKQNATRLDATIPGVPPATVIARYDLGEAYVVLLGRCLARQALDTPQLPPDVLRRADSVQFVGKETVNNKTVDHWRVTDAEAGNIPVDLWFLSGTNNLFRIEVYYPPELVATVQFNTFRAQSHSPSLFTQPRNCPEGADGALGTGLLRPVLDLMRAVRA